MLEFLFLLLPIAFYSGWHSARKRYKKKNSDLTQNKPLVKGINYLLNEEPDKALAFFIQHPDIDEYTAETFLLLGNSFRNRGEMDRALKVHQNLVARPNLSQSQRRAAMFALGQDFFAAGMLDKAEAVFKELLKKSTDGNKQACKPLREIYEQLGEWEKAIEITEYESDKSDESNRLIAHYHCEIATRALQKGNIYQVNEQLKLALKADKSSIRVKSLRGDIALYEEAYAKARKIYFDVIKADSRLLGVLFGRLLEIADKTNNFEKLYNFLNETYQKFDENAVLEHLLEVANKDEYNILVKNEKPIVALIETELTHRKPGLKTILQALHIMQKLAKENDCELILLIKQALEKNLQGQLRFQCQHCGYKMNDYLWRCPVCRNWDTIAEATI
jgi:lipopolysaccharide biosynthesis regulator YciM